MTAGMRAFLILLLVALISLGSATGATGYFVYQSVAPIIHDDGGPKHMGYWDLAPGFGWSSFYVGVREKSPDGVDFSLRIPALLVNLGLRFVPMELPPEATGEVAGLVPFLRTLGEEIGRCPDGDFIEVYDQGETVRISKRGRLIVLRVDTNDVEVDIAIPLSSFRTIVGKLARASASASS